ncbi:hypothetical protein [Methylobacter sp.]|uniref:hypothetical protein n=1 Tax=Methylobacter sp. TaxID=2051955 RepID=UPI003DA29017
MTASHRPAALLLRFIRYRDAPAYLSMDRNRFNEEVRPFLTVIPIGKQGIAFDRLDLDRLGQMIIFNAMGVPLAN